MRLLQEQEARGLASFGELARAAGRSAAADLPVVCVQGLGFVGSAMAIAVADACNTRRGPCFNVAGVDLPTPDGLAKVEAINAGRLPVTANDDKLKTALAAAGARGNLVATTDERAYALASVTLVDLPLDVVHPDGLPTVRLDGFRAAIRTLGDQMPPGSLVIVETTVPPGTTEKLVAPELARALAARRLPPDAIRVAYSYERVMPGASYFDSIVAIPRSYAGHTTAAADACEAFLSKVIDVEAHPLTRLASTTACEMAKVLENSYRATIIAFMEEWGRFAEAVGVDLFDVVETIRARPTHSNMRRPGFGVGGYCLTKDPLLAAVSARELHQRPDLQFPFSTLAVTVNRTTPMVSLTKVDALLPRGLQGATILLMGVSYREEVADTRESPSETFVRAARARGATVLCHDPLVRYWSELEMTVPADLPSLTGIDAVVFAVPHESYRELDLERWLGEARPVVLDAFDVLSHAQRAVLARLGCTTASIGRGERA
ncbi:MAG: nucleotide sugar dehydrogenase [Actinomycetota bacterium]|nr:nucleotide sugar dehydrogenase [Actinomycetota bacterium]